MTEEERIALEKRENERYLCPCGSGKYYENQYDGHGIYLCRTCPDCYEEKMGGFRADIHERYDCDEPIDED